ncbi:MAG: histidine kinase [Lachnospiraceae bacterium]|nr:histidine kinase [Lachnospiraceae bacterium]
MKKETGSKKARLNFSMVLLIMFCFLIPITALSVVMLTFVSQRFNSQINLSVTNTANRAIKTVELQLEGCENASRNATYFDIISEKYEKFLIYGDATELTNEINLYLQKQYRYSLGVKSSMVVFENKNTQVCSAFTKGNSPKGINDFINNGGIQSVMNLYDAIDTNIYYYIGDNGIYMLRKLVDSDFVSYGMIILELDTDYIFDQLSGIWGFESAGVYIDGRLIYGDEVEMPKDIEPKDDTDQCRIIQTGNTYYVYYKSELDLQPITYLIKLNTDILRGENRAVYYVFLIIIIMIIPLSISVLWFISVRVNRPINSLVLASSRIAGGDYGYRIADEAKNYEFDVINKEFNAMSEKLKTQFEQIYLEELALKDANIKALQSQINPHFLNNTLEIINWEARLQGADNVSSMIEALSTMLNATLNRKQVQLIELKEELEYVDAYLYIIKERMGSRIVITKEIDETLLALMVPALIIQPVIENAVEHGCAFGEGKVALLVYEKEDFVYIDVKNSGNMTAEDKEKTDKLLDTESKDEVKKSVSIGIRNVNKRLKLLFGEECGLKIFNEGEYTVSRLRIKRTAGEGENNKDEKK